RARVVQDEGGIEALGSPRNPPAEALPGALRRLPSSGTDQLLSAGWRQQGGLGQRRHLRMAWVPDADQDRFSLPRLDLGCAAGVGLSPFSRPGAACGHEGNPGVAVVLLQESDVRSGALSRTRPLHSTDEAEEHAALPAWRGADHPPRGRVLRVTRGVAGNGGKQRWLRN